VKDGWEAMEYLEKRRVYAKSKTPNLILPFVSSPKMNGLEVFKNIRCQEHFKHLPVRMLSEYSSRKMC